MQRNYKVKQITSLYDSCNDCGLSIINCICKNSPKIESDAKIWILSTEREFYRSSNTARLLALVNSESTEIFLWQRNKEPGNLIKYIDDGKYDVYLLFPTEDEESKSRKVIYEDTGKTPAFILIDGTWKEARKIYRKSDYLKKLPIISLKPNHKSNYDLRRGGKGNLCTIEAAIEALKLNGEVENSIIIDKFYNLFLRKYKASASGHTLKD